MFGLKINEFDNSDGTIKSFNKIFPSTPLEDSGEVEILGITDLANYTTSVYIRDIEVNGVVRQHNFGSGNFVDYVDFVENVRFKYLAKDLDGRIIAKAYNFKDLAGLLDVGVGILKRRIKSVIDGTTDTKHKFNINRIEL